LKRLNQAKQESVYDYYEDRTLLLNGGAFGYKCELFNAGRNPKIERHGRFYRPFRHTGMPKETPREIPPELYGVYAIPMGMMYFIPPKRYKDCDD
jgi:hypothetical protein